MATHDDLRGWIAEQVRSRVAGPDAAQRHTAFDAAATERWFDDDAVIRRVHADSAMFVGGLRALLLQSLHPLAMAGVADHSDYRADPWGRLQRTAYFLAATTFGSAQQSEQAVARVRSVHEHVVGVAPDGRPYRADDPHLLRWVHVAEVDSFLAAYRRYGSEPLTDAEADEYVAQMAVIARARGAGPARVGALARRPAPFVPPRAARDPAGPRRRPLPAVAAADVVGRSRAVRGPGGERGRPAPALGTSTARSALVATRRGGRGPTRRRRRHPDASMGVARTARRS